MPVMMTSSEGGAGGISFFLFADGVFGARFSDFRPTFAIAPLFLQADRLSFQLTCCLMDRGEQVRVGTLSNQLMVMIVGRGFGAVEMTILGKDDAHSQFTFLRV